MKAHVEIQIFSRENYKGPSRKTSPVKKTIWALGGTQ